MTIGTPDDHRARRAGPAPVPVAVALPGAGALAWRFAWPRRLAAVAALSLGLMLLALVRPIDHDESQYVAATVLALHGLPYRDFAYLQTPLQPILLAPVAMIAGTWLYPVLRFVNALLGAAALIASFAAAREAGASPRAAALATAMMACTDIFLFTSAVARNDALPGAALATALWLAVRAAHGRGSRLGALLAGMLLALAAAVKISFAIPALGYGLYALVDRRHRPAMLALGAAPVVIVTAALFIAAPEGFLFGVLRFPALAPIEWYRAQHLPAKLSLLGKGLDTIKFLALGPALLALVLTARARQKGSAARLLDLFLVSGIVAALLPVPTWRQYLLPILPALFVRLALLWHAHPPGRALRIAAVVFAVGGLAPSIEAMGGAIAGGPPLLAVIDAGKALRARFIAAGGTGPVATLAPQILPGARLEIDPRFAAGPFYFRSQGLLDARAEARLHLVSRATLAQARPPRAIVTGGEGAWSAGEARDEAPLIGYARAHGWRRLPVAGTRLTLWLPPR